MPNIYSNIESLKKDAHIDEKFIKLYKKFSPGPLTYILRKRKNSKISPLANANLKTIAVRFPKNKIIRTLLKKLKFPLAIPSANISLLLFLYFFPKTMNAALSSFVLQLSLTGIPGE